MQHSRPRVAVVGHVEWVTFAHVDHIPREGEIVHAYEPLELPAGGGAVAAVQLARLAGSCVLVTALGEDEHGRRAVAQLRELGVEVWAAQRTEPTRTAVTLVDSGRERTITTFGSRLEAKGEDANIPWRELGAMDGVYFTAGDVGALQAARGAQTLVSSPRALHAVGHGIQLDALVLSADDGVERREAVAVEDEAQLVAVTEGERGGSYRRRDGKMGKWDPAPLPGKPVDTYGCGDSFAAGLTYGLAAGLAIDDALRLGARCGATCITGRGPYEQQLRMAA